MRLVPVDYEPEFPAGAGAPRLVPVDYAPEFDDEPAVEDQDPDPGFSFDGAARLADLMATQREQLKPVIEAARRQGIAPLPAGADYEREGTFFKYLPGGSSVPVGEKPVEQPLYDPVDLAADLGSGGITGAGRAGLAWVSRKAAQSLAADAGLLTGRQALGLVGKAAGLGAARDAAYGSVAGSAMEATDQATDSTLSALAAGFGAPTAAKLSSMAARKGLGWGLDWAVGKAAKGLAKDAWAWPVEGRPSAGVLMRRLGTRAEAVGPDVAGELATHEARLARDLKEIQAEMGRWTLAEPMQKFLTGRAMGWLVPPEDALILGQRARDLAARVSPKLAARLGLTPEELRTAARLVETIPGKEPVDANGVLRFGVQVKDRGGSQGWAHELEPGAARDLFLEQRPEVQRLVLAYVAPFGGWQRPPRVAGQGYRPGPAALKLVRERLGLSPAYLERELFSQGRERWVGALTAGGLDEAQVRLAAEHLEYLAKRRRMYPEALEFVKSNRGGVDFGEISPEVAETIRYAPGPVRLQAGSARFGDLHINQKHLKELNQEGYRDAREFVEDVAGNYNAIFQGQGDSLLLVKRNGKAKVAFIEIEPSLDGDFYSVSSAVVSRDTYLTNKKLLWERAQSSQPQGLPSAHSDQSNKKRLLWGRAPTSQQQGPPSAVSGQSNLPPTRLAPKPGEIKDLPTPPALGKAALFPLGRNAGHQRLVQAGILQPDQYNPSYLGLFGLPEPDAALGGQGPSLNLNKVYEPMAQRRGPWRAEDRRLDQAVTAQRLVAQEAVSHRRLLRNLAPVILEPAPAERLQPEDMVRVREVFSPWDGRVMRRHEVMSRVTVDAEEAEVLGVRPGDYLMPAALDDQFRVLLGKKREGKSGSWLENASRAARDLTSYWVMNVLSAPGTIATNLLGGAAQYSGKWWEDLARGPRQAVNTTLAPFLALTPAYRRMLPSSAFGEGANLARHLGSDAGHFLKDVRARAQAGEPLGPATKAAAAGDAVLAGALKAHLAPFSAVDDYWKRAVFISEARKAAQDHADGGRAAPGEWAGWRRAGQRDHQHGNPAHHGSPSLGLNKAGKAARADRARLVREYQETLLDQRPEEFARILLGPVDRFAYLYQNIPAWLDSWRKSTWGRLIWPFGVYPYKYARMVGSQANALNPFSAMPAKERGQRLLGLVGSAAAPYLGLKAYQAATGQESRVQELRERWTQEHPGEDWPGTRLGGRVFLGKAEPGPQGQERETWLRTIKYGPLNLWPLVSGDKADVLGDMKSIGPMVPLMGNLLLELAPRFGPRDPAGQAGELAAGFVPFHRWLDYLAKAGDTDEAGNQRRRTARGFGQQVMKILPGLRQELPQPVDPRTGWPQTWDPRHEALKFWTGVNLRDVEVPAEKKAVAERHLRTGRAWMKESELAEALAALDPRLDRARISEHLGEILQAGQDQLRRVEKGLAYLGYSGLEEVTQGKLDPLDLPQQEAALGLTDRAARGAVKAMTGQKSQERARQTLRMLGARNWLADHWELVSKEGER